MTILQEIVLTLEKKEQLQQMLNLEAEEQTHLLTSRQDSPTQNYKSPLNLSMVGMAPPHSYL